MNEEIITPKMVKEAQAKAWRSKFFKPEEEERKKHWFTKTIQFFLAVFLWKAYSALGVLAVTMVSIPIGAGEGIFSTMVFVMMVVMVVPAYLSARWIVDKATARLARNEK